MSESPLTSEGEPQKAVTQFLDTTLSELAQEDGLSKGEVALVLFSAAVTAAFVYSVSGSPLWAAIAFLVPPAGAAAYEGVNRLLEELPFL